MKLLPLLLLLSTSVYAAGGGSGTTTWLAADLGAAFTLRDDNGTPGTIMNFGQLAGGVEFNNIGLMLSWHEVDMDTSEDHFRLLGEQTIYGFGITYRLDDDEVPLWFSSASHLIGSFQLQRGWARYEFRDTDHSGASTFTHADAWGWRLGLTYETHLWRGVYWLVDLAYDSNRFSAVIPSGEKNYWNALLTASTGLSVRF
jgi:hypothetical protein